MEYRYETQLVSDLSDCLTSSQKPFDVEHFAYEFNYINGRVDLLAIKGKGTILSFEAKLSKWKIALNQAYRNSSFTHYSYVVLPDKQIKYAMKNSKEFQIRGVGLCSVKDENLNIIMLAPKKKPLQPWLTKKALKFINENSHE